MSVPTAAPKFTSLKWLGHEGETLSAPISLFQPPVPKKRKAAYWRIEKSPLNVILILKFVALEIAIAIVFFAWLYRDVVAQVHK